MTTAVQANAAPPWLTVMRGITGMTEAPGSANNPAIMNMADVIAKAYPQQATYCSYYTGDDIAWCGLAVAYCMTMAGIEPVFGATDTERWMWALAWAEWPQSTHLAEPQLGCVMVKEREGGGHVCLYESTDGSYYRVRGGNQRDMVNVSSYPRSDFVAFVWPDAAGAPRARVKRSPEDVAWVQVSLNELNGAKLDIDGEMGPHTSNAISAYQNATVLCGTGIANKNTVRQMLEDLETWNEARGS